MSTRVVDRVDEWGERPFADGYRSLHEFADEEFSGVVRAGGAELFMTKGTVVGIRHGDIGDFEDGTGTAYEAPSPALPLLAIMQETNDEVRAEYYSEKTSIAEVDSTLSDGGFTGYVELAENVLSGDYYQVYHAGHSMSVGFIGESARLVDGDEAFDTANDEVGIYQVRPAEVDAIEIPAVESDPDPPAVDNDSETVGESETEERDESAESVDETESDSPEEPAETTDTEVDTHANETDGVADTTEPETAGGDDEDEQVGTREPTDGPEGDQGEPVTPTASAGGDSTDVTPDAERSSSATRQRSDGAERATTESDSVTPSSEQQPSSAETTETTAGGATPEVREREVDTTTDVDSQPQSTSGKADRTREQTQIPQTTNQTGRSSETAGSELDLETRAIPSLDPERTSEPDEGSGSARDTFTRTRNNRSAETTRPQNTRPTKTTATQSPPQSASREEQPETQRTSQSAETTAGSASTEQRTETASTETGDDSGSAVDSERLEELETEIDERESEIDRLESEVSRKTTEYEDAKSQLEEVRAERDELAAEVERLESELEQLETQFGAATDADRRMTPAEALSGTDIFPRYQSKGDATLKKAHGGSHRREDVLGNLRLEQNTQFDAENVSVGGQTYHEFLESTLEYRFVDWIVGNLLFEIRETGHEKALKDLYDALPVIDWADLRGTVDVVYTEDGQETRSQESFDIVLRNRMGEPLIVANLNDSREGATKSMMENLVRAAERVGQSSDAFAGAFLVTRSFFEPPALETADDATKGGLLSRDKRKSFVNLSRKNGYHLCLVEARNENFTLLVPEL